MANISIRFSNFRSLFLKRLAGFFDPGFLRDISIRVLGGTSLVMIVLLWIYALFYFVPADYLVPLRYNSFLGVTELGSWYQLYAVPLILIFLFVTNLLLANAAYSKDKMVSYILMGANIFVTACGATVVLSLSMMLNR